MTAPPKRTRYFDGQLLRAEDLARDQEYFRERLRRHNRALHGFGVVCGLAVEVSPQRAAGGSKTLTVSLGYALSRQGDEILVTEPVSRPFTLAAERSIVAIRYDERLVDPVPAPTGMPGGDTTQFSAVEETYVVEVFDASRHALDDRWVVLAAVTCDQNGHVVIDTSARQHVRQSH